MLNLNLPTNRNLENSRISVDAAANFSEQTGARLIIVNSCFEPEKLSYLRKIQRKFTNVLCINNETQYSNLEIALKEKQMGFSAFLADDDIIYCLRSFNAKILSEVPSSIIGIIPQVQVFSENGIERINRINSGEDGLANPEHFGATSNGANTGLFGWYRSEIWTTGILAAKNSPSFKVGVWDWPFSIAMSCFGAIATDTNTVYAYDITNWKGDPKFINSQVEGLFSNANFHKDLAKVLSRIKLLDFIIITSTIKSQMGLAPEGEIFDRAAASLCGLSITRQNVDESLALIRDIDQGYADKIRPMIPKI